MANYTGKVWKSGKDLGSSYAARAARRRSSRPAEVRSSRRSRTRLVGQKVGSRVLVVAPPAAGFGSQGNQQAGSRAPTRWSSCSTSSKIIPKMAEGKQAPSPTGPAEGQGRQAGGPPRSTCRRRTRRRSSSTRSSSRARAPRSRADKTRAHAVQGRGLEATRASEARSSTPRTARGAAVHARSRSRQVIKGWDQGLIGKKVGSRVLLVIPPELAYGDSRPRARPPGELDAGVRRGHPGDVVGPDRLAGRDARLSRVAHTVHSRSK